jgi:hypothetical protein
MNTPENIPENIYLVLVDPNQFEKLMVERLLKKQPRHEAYNEICAEVHKYFPLHPLPKNWESWYQAKYYKLMKQRGVNLREKYKKATS